MSRQPPQLNETCAYMRDLGCVVIVAKVYKHITPNVALPRGFLEMILPYAGASRTTKIASVTWLIDNRAADTQTAKLIVHPSHIRLNLTRPNHTSLQGTGKSRGLNVLILGVANSQVYVSVLPVTGPESRTTRTYLGALPVVGSFADLRLLHFGSSAESRELLTKLSKIIGKQHRHMRMNADGLKTTCVKSQAAGYTMEALLGVSSNARPEPDYSGFEVKTYSSSTVTLLTTEPDLGLRGSAGGFSKFMHLHGKPKAGRRNVRLFNGVHILNQRHSKTKMTLSLENYNCLEPGYTDEILPSIMLRTDDKSLSAGWSSQKISSHWETKHANALYIKSEKSTNKVAYSGEVYLCSGAKYERFLAALSMGLIVYDPADEVYGDKNRRRSQWRLRRTREYTMEQALCVIYECVVRVTLQ